MRTFAIVLLIALIAQPVPAEEKPVQLQNAPGVEIVAVNCQACHSLGYIPMNSPFLKPAQWDAVVNKMIKTMGAPISDVDAKAIASYLKKNYGG
jgi:sulfite dehydrogenase (cytochrome) subunit B